MQYLINWLEILFRKLLLIAQILLHIAKMLVGISLGALYGACSSAIFIAYDIFSSLIIHLASIIPVLWSVFNVYRTQGHNLFFTISACILHLPFLLTYASISLVILSILDLATVPIFVILYFAYLGIEMNELKNLVIKDYNRISSTSYYFFYESFLYIYRSANDYNERFHHERARALLNHGSKITTWIFINFAYLATIYYFYLFIRIFEHSITQEEPERKIIENNIEEEIYQCLANQGEKLLANSKHTILSDEIIYKYKSYQNAKIDELLSSYKELKEQLLEKDECPILLNRPSKEDSIIVCIPNKTEILYSKSSYKNHIKTKLLEHATEIKDPATNIQIASIGPSISINTEMYIQPLYTDKDNTFYSAKINEIENKIKEIVTELQIPQENPLKVTKDTKRTPSFPMNIFGRNGKSELDKENMSNIRRPFFLTSA